MHPHEPDPEQYQKRIDQLRQWRNYREPDRGMTFVKSWFQRALQKPHRQLGEIGEIWLELCPPDLVDKTRLEGLSRGVLRVAADSATTLYELDRALRSGLEEQLITAYRGGALRRVKVRVAPKA